MINVKFNPVDFSRYMFALEKLKSMATLQKDDMQYHSAVEFHQLLIFNLNHEKFKGGFSAAGGEGFGAYAPYHPQYAAWKHSSGNFWKLEGDLIRNIVKRRIGSPRGWAVGVNDVKDVGGKSWYGKDDKGKPKSIGMYAIVAEFGGDYGKGGRHPGRPLFRPTRTEFEHDGWPKEGYKSLKKMGNQWS